MEVSTLVDTTGHGPGWRTSTRSGADGQCVQVARLAHAVAIRDSKDPAGPVLEFSPEAWTAFVRGAKHGDFDLGARDPEPPPTAGGPQPGTRPTAAKVADHSGLA
jgi:hypothetical protein